LNVTPDFYDFFYYILLYMMYTKYIIICTIIYSLVCVLNFILFAGRLYFVNVTYYIKGLANETGKFISVRSEEANWRLLKTWGFDVTKIIAKLHWLLTNAYNEQHIYYY